MKEEREKRENTDIQKTVEGEESDVGLFRCRAETTLGSILKKKGWR